MALEAKVLGREAAEDMLARGQADYLDFLTRVVPAMSAGIILIAKEIDALKATITGTDDETSPR